MKDYLERIKKIEALIARAHTKGERKAAQSAKQRLLGKYPELDLQNNKREFALYTQGNWQKKLLLALCGKYGIEPYRYKRQKHTTVMVNINEHFLNEVFWKEFLEYSEQLEDLIEDLTDNLIRQIHKPKDEAIIGGQLE